MTDQNFPHIEYDPAHSYKEWGRLHGESYRTGVRELAAIRKELLLNKAPWLKKKIKELALKQAEVTKSFHHGLYQELQGIAEGSTLSLEDIVILNNYTDFRDIRLPEEGCSSLYAHTEADSFSGQTWDMHESAKQYLCTIKLKSDGQEMVVLSLVGCLGLMGVNAHNLLIGVNNINTLNAEAALVWPALVRATLLERDFNSAKSLLECAPVTSGHNYLLVQKNHGLHMEVSPNLAEVVSELHNKRGVLFHTNHCLGPEHKKREDIISQNSTTYEREKILTQKASTLKTADDLVELLQDHEGHPKSICSHFKANAQDPSLTCGGGVYSSTTFKFKLWRGCPKYDSFYKERVFKRDGVSFTIA